MREPDRVHDRVLQVVHQRDRSAERRRRSPPLSLRPPPATQGAWSDPWPGREKRTPPQKSPEQSGGANAAEDGRVAGLRKSTLAGFHALAMQVLCACAHFRACGLWMPRVDALPDPQGGCRGQDESVPAALSFCKRDA